MTEKLNVNDANQVKYYTEDNPDSTYYAPISCSMDGSGVGPEPTDPPTSRPRPTTQAPSKPKPDDTANPNTGTCGQTFVPQRVSRIQTQPKGSSGRIVGGVEAKPHSFPWIVSLQSNSNFHFCGGTLIRVNGGDQSDIVVTAAHCVYDSHPGMQVVAGAHDLEDESGSEQRVRASLTDYHESYNPDTMVNDIAIVKLSKPIKFTNDVQPACLPNPGEQIPDNAPGTVAGWGLTREEGRSSNLLLQVSVPIVNNNTCSANYKPMKVFPQVMICAGYSFGGKDACQGDSGGPLTFQSSQGYVLQGVVSFGIGCARSGKPGIYARVSNYIPWINSKIQEYSALNKSG
jgi:transmembrane serine protease 3